MKRAKPPEVGLDRPVEKFPGHDTEMPTTLCDIFLSVGERDLSYIKERADRMEKDLRALRALESCLEGLKKPKANGHAEAPKKARKPRVTGRRSQGKAPSQLARNIRGAVDAGPMEYKAVAEILKVTPQAVRVCVARNSETLMMDDNDYVSAVRQEPDEAP